jgi:hypothetical protein
LRHYSNDPSPTLPNRGGRKKVIIFFPNRGGGTKSSFSPRRERS